MFFILEVNIALFLQIAQLEAFFNVNEYIDGERKKQLSRLTNIPEQQIKVWFQNRRQKKKREVEEMQQQALQQERIQQVRIIIAYQLPGTFQFFHIVQYISRRFHSDSYWRSWS